MAHLPYAISATFTAGSNTVTAAVGAFLANVTPGDFVRGPDEKVYGVVAVGSNTQVTLDRNYLGTTATADVVFFRHSDTWASIADANTRLARIEEAMARGYTLTSASSLAIGTGTKVFTGVEGGLNILKGIALRATSRSDPNKWMLGSCDYSGTTLTMTVTHTGGSGTVTDWNINISGPPGPQGATGASGTNGTNGTNGIDGTDYAPTTLPSAATVNIGGAATGTALITGTTTITSFGTVAGSRRFVRFAGALTIKHHATSLILPGGLDITTAAGDIAEFISDASGNWRCFAYSRADGTALLTRGPTQQVFTSSGTWTRPAGCKRVRVCVLGGGGGGGGALGGSSQAGMGVGGGAGSYSEGIFDVTAIATATVTVGAGGSGGAATPTAGSNGGTSAFGSLITGVSGGNGGAYQGAGTSAVFTNPGTAAGAGAGGAVNTTGQIGGQASRLSGTSAIGGIGAASAYGTGGRPTVSSANGGAAGGYGSGGAGATSLTTTGYAGGDGSSGIIIVEEFY